MWYMGVDKSGCPNGWDIEPWGEAIKVSDDIRALHEAHPDYVWDGVALVQPVQPTVPPPTVLELQAFVKAEAERRILNILPAWKQRNYTARAVEIIYAIQTSTAAAEDTAELTAIHGFFDRVKAIRAASDLVEADVERGAIRTHDEAVGSALWPE